MTRDLNCMVLGLSRLREVEAIGPVRAKRIAAPSKTLIVIGQPDVGKTILVNLIFKMLVTKGVAVMLCAHTGRDGMSARGARAEGVVTI